MESEFINDLDKLHEAFRMYVKEDEEHRSIIVIAGDVNDDGEDIVNIQSIGRNRLLAESLTTFLERDDDRPSYIDAVMQHFMEEGIQRDTRTFRAVSAALFVVSIAWVGFLIYRFVEAGHMMAFISNMIPSVWSVILTGYFTCKKWR